MRNPETPTQMLIYLYPSQAAAVRAISRETGVPLSVLFRDAADRIIEARGRPKAAVPAVPPENSNP